MYLCNKEDNVHLGSWFCRIKSFSLQSFSLQLLFCENNSLDVQYSLLITLNMFLSFSLSNYPLLLFMIALSLYSLFFLQLYPFIVVISVVLSFYLSVFLSVLLVVCLKVIYPFLLNVLYLFRNNQFILILLHCLLIFI